MSGAGVGLDFGCVTLEAMATATAEELLVHVAAAVRTALEAELFERASSAHGGSTSAIGTAAAAAAAGALSINKGRVVQLGRWKGRETADFASKAPIVAWRRAAAGVPPGLGAVAVDAHELAVGVAQRLRTSAACADGAALAAVRVRSEGTLEITTAARVAQQRANGRERCGSCGAFFARGRPLRDHRLDAGAGSPCGARDDSVSDWCSPFLARQAAAASAAAAEAADATEAGRCTESAAQAAQPTPLTLEERAFEAARTGDLAALETALAVGLDPTRAFDRNGCSPLHWAAGSGHLSVCRRLTTAVSEAAGGGDRGAAAAHALASAASRKHGRCPLHWAARNGRLGVARWLVAECGVTPDARSSGGDTPLMLSAWQGHLDLCLLLADAGADVGAVNSWGCNAFHKVRQFVNVCPLLAVACLLPLNLCFAANSLHPHRHCTCARSLAAFGPTAAAGCAYGRRALEHGAARFPR